MVTDLVLARWRVFVQATVGSWALALVTYLAQYTPLVDEQIVTWSVATVTGVGIGVYYMAATYLVNRFPSWT
ncbi:MAG: hypothetical protein ACREF4_09190, partial [Gammaproteobacteria bacterium]